MMVVMVMIDDDVGVCVDCCGGDFGGGCGGG